VVVFIHYIRSVIGHFQLLGHNCGTAFRPTYDSLTLLFSSSAGR